MNFSIMQAFPLYCHFVPLRPKYLLQDSIPENLPCSFLSVTAMSHTDTNQRRTVLGIAAMKSCIPYACNGEYCILTQ